jgi:hypothetical protein
MGNDKKDGAKEREGKERERKETEMETATFAVLKKKKNLFVHTA